MREAVQRAGSKEDPKLVGRLTLDMHAECAPLINRVHSHLTGAECRQLLLTANMNLFYSFLSGMLLSNITMLCGLLAHLEQVHVIRSVSIRMKFTGSRKLHTNFTATASPNMTVCEPLVSGSCLSILSRAACNALFIAVYIPAVISIKFLHRKQED